ncbi:AbiJ-NTD4 domain-containing protein [Marinobacter sp.]|uniref:AbiJ-NTD4 domain-containing protein n=1 Tax=Marinobacter sp. TaxID=50741 RepID=UPI003A925D65
MTEFKAPFSARHRGKRQHIDNDFPESARVGLLHLLYDLEEKEFVAGWPAIARELQRISRQAPTSYQSNSVTDLVKARNEAEETLSSLNWDKLYDFCERLYSYLSQDVLEWMEFDVSRVSTPKSEVQFFISEELERLFLEENLVFEFSEGLVRRRGRRHTEDQAARAHLVLGDNRLADSRKHYTKALHFFRHPTNPDYENCVKESVCAVEAAGKALFPEAKATTLGNLAKWLVTANDYDIPKALVKTIEGIYAYRSGGNGVGHGGAQGGTATVEVAEYVLSVCASQIIYLVDIEEKHDDIPF